MNTPTDRWNSAGAYETFMGRWSRRLARAFVEWLDPEPDGRWLDIGCGTGALTAAVLDRAAPKLVIGCDPAEAFVRHARDSIDSAAASFEVAGIDRLPQVEHGFDGIVSGLVLNFLPDPDAALEAMKSRLRPGGLVAACVWDYADGMAYLRMFWDEALALDPAAAELDEGSRFPICREGALPELFARRGLVGVRSGAISIQTDFRDFNDFWEPLTMGTGPAPAYASGLDPDRKRALMEGLKARFTPGGDGPISLTARAWAAAGFLEARAGSDP